MAIADEVEPRPARAHAVACLALRHCVEGAGRTPLVCAACHCAAGPAAASKAIHARVRGVAATRTALVAVGCVGVQGLRLEGRARVVAKGETEPTWPRRNHSGESRGRSTRPPRNFQSKERAARTCALCWPMLTSRNGPFCTCACDCLLYLCHVSVTCSASVVCLFVINTHALARNEILEILTNSALASREKPRATATG